MKHTARVLCVIALLAASPIAAQVRHETKLTYDVITHERKGLVMNALDITGAQAKAFAPVYDEYLAELQALQAKKADLIKRFLASYKAVEDTQAEQMTDELLDLSQDDLDLKRYYTRRFQGILPARKVLRLWQIENKLDTVVAAELVKDIPLAN